MASLKDALASVAGSVDWSDIPKDSLSTFLRETFSNAETLANSVPLPPSSESSSSQAPPTKVAASSADTLFTGSPNELDSRHAELQKAWGKPVKINAKDNPLNVSVYKAAGGDRKGAWFARRSVHTGLSFRKWKDSMAREFLTSLKVQGGPGAGAVRGIAGDKRLEKEDVQGLGTAAVWLLSSAFPGPVAPRDFVSVIITSDNALSKDSEIGGKIPRHLMIVSRPTQHSEGGARDGLVRGNYESVELLRELPGSDEKADSCLMEWIMVTRSDPGGGIPRFMVERGTPPSIVADVPKFIDWVITRDDSKDEAEEEQEAEAVNEQQPAPSEPQQESVPKGDGTATQARRASDHVSYGQRPSISQQQQPQQQQQEGQGESSLLGGLTTAIGASVGGYWYGNDQQEPHQHSRPRTPDSLSSTSSDDTFQDASEGEGDTSSGDSTSVRQPSKDSKESTFNSTINTNHLGQHSPTSSISLDQNPSNHHEKEIQRLQKKRLHLDDKLAKQKEADDKRTADALTKEESEKQKVVDKTEKERRKQEEKYAKEMRQLESKKEKHERKAQESREKEARRAEQKARKAKEKDALLKVSRERDEALQSLRDVEAERDALKVQMQALQAENTLLVQGIGQGETGSEFLRRIKDDAEGRSRASSGGSVKSNRVSVPAPTSELEKLAAEKASSRRSLETLPTGKAPLSTT